MFEEVTLQEITRLPTIIMLSSGPEALGLSQNIICMRKRENSLHSDRDYQNAFSYLSLQVLRNDTPISL